MLALHSIVGSCVLGISLKSLLDRYHQVIQSSYSIVYRYFGTTYGTMGKSVLELSTKIIILKMTA